MPVLVDKYECLRKPEADGKLTPFQPLRAVGLALEKAWRLYKAKGHNSVTAEALGAVEVTGSRQQGLALQVQGGSSWQNCLAATLQLRPEDADLSKALFDQTFKYIQDLHAAVLDVDLPWPSGDGSFDLILDPYQQLCGVTGRVWVELKVWKPQTYKTEANKVREFLVAKLEEVHAAEPTIQGVILAVLKVGRSGRAWGDPDFVVEFRACGSESWRDLSPRGGKVAADGQVRPARNSNGDAKHGPEADVRAAKRNVFSMRVVQLQSKRLDGWLPSAPGHRGLPHRELLDARALGTAAASGRDGETHCKHGGVPSSELCQRSVALWPWYDWCVE